MQAICAKLAAGAKSAAENTIHWQKERRGPLQNLGRFIEFPPFHKADRTGIGYTKTDENNQAGFWVPHAQAFVYDALAIAGVDFLASPLISLQ